MFIFINMENLLAMLPRPQLMFVTVMNTGGRMTTEAVFTVNNLIGSTGSSFGLFPTWLCFNSLFNIFLIDRFARLLTQNCLIQKLFLPSHKHTLSIIGCVCCNSSSWKERLRGCLQDGK